MKPPKGFKAERHPTTGAVVAWDELVRKFVVLDCHGDEHAFRRSLDEARALAASLPGDPWAPSELSINISPRSLRARQAQAAAVRRWAVGQDAGLWKGTHDDADDDC